MSCGKSEALHFINMLQNLNEKDYLFSLIAYRAAPTIWGGKPASLVTFTKGVKNPYDLWSLYKLEICKKLKLEFIEIKDTGKSIRVLFYKGKILQRYINKKECRRFLYDMGYAVEMGLNECLMQLKQRFECLCPHEIGVFLGIPVEDIKGFIQHKGEKSLMCSKYWKVYKNPRRSLSLFNTYDKAMAFVPGAIEKIHAYY